MVQLPLQAAQVGVSPPLHLIEQTPVNPEQEWFSIRHRSPRNAFARVVIAATSEPASGSESANAAIESPAATPGR